jgi:hypothetical protein
MWLAVCATITLLFPSPRLWPALGLGAVVGFMGGVLQGRAIRANPAAFRAADSPAAVRRALVASPPAATAIRLQWVFAVALLVLALSGPTHRFISVALAGYFAMMLVRELVAYPSLVWLQSR